MLPLFWEKWAIRCSTWMLVNPTNNNFHRWTNLFGSWGDKLSQFNYFIVFFYIVHKFYTLRGCNFIGTRFYHVYVDRGSLRQTHLWVTSFRGRVSYSTLTKITGEDYFFYSTKIFWKTSVKKIKMNQFFWSNVVLLVSRKTIQTPAEMITLANSKYLVICW